jgi:hypothetical protein
MRAHWQLLLVAAICGLMAGGCAQVWDDIAMSLWRADSAGNIQKEDIAVLSNSTLSDFTTAAGPAPAGQESLAANT